MQRMKSFVAFLLALLLLSGIVPALAGYTTEDIDRQFIRYLDNGSRWKRSASGWGPEADITESAWLDGHEYTFRAMSDGTGVAEVALSGWFSDLRMNSNATFPAGLQALTSCIYAVDSLVPTHNVSNIISPYDVYEELRNGRVYDTYGIDGWTFQYIGVGRIEASHSSGAYLIMSANGSYFNFTFTSQ